MATLRELEEELAKDPELVQVYEDIQPELAVMRVIADSVAISSKKCIVTTQISSI